LFKKRQTPFDHIEAAASPQHHEKCHDPRNRNCEHQKDAKYDFHKTPPDAARMLALQSNRRKP
jgi:hypothetical protein